MTPIRAERARIPRRSGGSFLRRKYGKDAVGERCRAGRDLAGIGKFDAEGQSVTLDQAAAPMRCAAGRQEQKKPVRQFDVILEIKPSATIRNIGNRTSKSRRKIALMTRKLDPGCHIPAYAAKGWAGARQSLALAKCVVSVTLR